MKTSIKKSQWWQLVALLVLCLMMFLVEQKLSHQQGLYPEEKPSVEQQTPSFHDLTGQTRFF
ncbi:MAG: hypothetical protein AAF740_07105 [Bacteroidota bacterium]